MPALRPSNARVSAVTITAQLLLEATSSQVVSEGSKNSVEPEILLRLVAFEG